MNKSLKFLKYPLILGVFTACCLLSSSQFTSIEELPKFQSRQSLLPNESLKGRSMDAKAIDLDKDGDLDLVIANEHRPNIILINDGKGNMTNDSKNRLPSAPHDSEDIALGDFDKDGDIDIVFVSEDDKVNEYYWNNGKGFFVQAKFSLPVTGKSNAVITTDLDNDGDLDLIIGNDGQNFALLNDGKGKFIDATAKILPKGNQTTQDLELGDVDGDGDLDLIVGNEDDNQLLINNGKGVFKDETAKRLPLQAGKEETREADFGDVDGDGDLDLIFSNVNFRQVKDHQNRLLINDGKGFFKDETMARLPKEKLHSIDADLVDIDGDRDLDLLIGNTFEQRGFQIMLNNGKGVFEDKTQEILKPFAVDVIDVEVADFNGDQLPDLYLCNFRGNDKLFLHTK
ncbi:hypothetical protein BKI52_44515 [marine bacterium AO1-C]|nr:hypothetical protein BKI52_44515 [marine bacterium AO1-C]